MDNELLAKLNQTRVNTLLIDLDLVLTLAALAETSSNPNTRKRYLRNAYQAFLRIRDTLLPLCEPNALQRIKIDAKLRKLSLRLVHLGSTPATFAIRRGKRGELIVN